MSKDSRLFIAFLLSAAMGVLCASIPQLLAAILAPIAITVWAVSPRESEIEKPDLYGDGGVA